MVPKKTEFSSLKRGRVRGSYSPSSILSFCLQLASEKNSTGDNQDLKKPRRSERISSQIQTTPLKEKGKSYLPSPLTHQESTATEEYKELTASPPEGSLNQIRRRTPPLSSPIRPSQLSSPPADTQAFSQFITPSKSISHEVDDEEAEGVWGYLVPLDNVFGETIVCRARAACPAPYPNSDFGKGTTKRGKGQIGELSYGDEEMSYEKDKRVLGFPSGGYLIGRHPECGMQACVCMAKL